MAQSCATFGFNPALVPSPSRSSLREHAGRTSPVQASSARTSSVQASSGRSSSVQAHSLRASSGSESLMSLRTSDSSTRSDWENLILERLDKGFIAWDLDRLTVLRKTIREWALMKVPYSSIGKYMELVLYQCDEHMDGRLTKMVNNRFRHVRIALEIMQYYQIRDDERQPLWLPAGQEYGDWFSLSGKSTESAEPVVESSIRRVRLVPDTALPVSPRPSSPQSTQYRDVGYAVGAPASPPPDVPLPSPPISILSRSPSSIFPRVAPLTDGPELMMYHRANPHMGHYIDAEGRVVLVHPPML